jgi:hypothetical protein
MPTRGETGLHAFRQMRKGQAASTIQRAFRSRRRRTKKSKYKKPLALKVQNFVERAAPDTLNVRPEATATGLFKSFQLNDIAQVNNYVQLFDEYKITKVVVTFRYKGIGQNARVVDITGANPITPVNEVNPVLYYKIDHNDDENDDLSNLKLSMKTREHQFTNNNPKFDIVIKPSNLISTDNMVGASPAIGTNRPKWGQWLHTPDDGIKYFGLKAYAVADTGAGTSYGGALEVTYKYYFSMKNNN